MDRRFDLSSTIYPRSTILTTSVALALAIPLAIAVPVPLAVAVALAVRLILLTVVLSVEPELVHDGSVPRRDKLLLDVRLVGKGQSGPAVHVLKPVRNVLRQGVVNRVIAVIMTSEPVGDVGGETGVVVAVGIGRVCCQRAALWLYSLL